MQDYWMTKMAAGDNPAEDAYVKKLQDERKQQQEDQRLTSSVNALAALGTAGGLGMLGTGMERQLGGVLAGASIGGAGLYHGARMLNASKTVRLLAALAGAVSGGVVGDALGDSLKREDIRDWVDKARTQEAIRYAADSLSRFTERYVARGTR